MEIVLSIDLGSPPDPAHRNLDRLHAIVKILRKSDETYRSFVATTLLDVYNDDWNSGESISRATFGERLRLRGVSVFGIGEKHIYFDSDMFPDHIIKVILFPDLEPEHASIEDSASTDTTDIPALIEDVKDEGKKQITDPLSPS